MLSVVALSLTAITVVAVQNEAQPAKADRTTEWLVRMTAREHAHAKVHKRWNGNTRLLDEMVSVVVEGMPFGSPEGETENEQLNAIQALKCRTNAVFIGLVTAAKSLPTEDGTYLFTDYIVRIDDSFRAPDAQPLLEGDLVTVTRPGGEMHVNNVTVSATSNTEPRLEVGGRYLLFTQFLPDVKDFVADVSSGTYRVAGDQLIDITYRDSRQQSAAAGQSRQLIENALLSKICRN
jgi:hypothetical protein